MADDKLKVSVTEAHSAAQAGLLNFIRTDDAEAGPSDSGLSHLSVENVKSWDWKASKASLDATDPAGMASAQVYDLDGSLLFYDFTLRLDDGSMARVRTAGTKAIGAPVLSVGVSTQLSTRASVAAAAEVARENQLKPMRLPTSVVCYSYPKIGLLCRDDAEKRWVIDLIDFQRYPVDDAPAEGAAPEAPGVWSFLDRLPDATQARVERYDKSQAAFQPRAAADDTLEAGAAEAQAEGQQNVVAGVNHVFQKTPAWCAVASGKMILDFHGHVHTQEEIAIAMKTGPAGTTNPDQIAGYQSLSQAKRSGTLEASPTFNVARDEIKEGRPLKFGIPRHARVIVGTKVDDKGSWLYIFDPWSGPIWELWGAVPPRNFIYVRRALIS